MVIFAEVMPKTYAIREADRMALKVAPILRPIVAGLAPITQAIQALVLFLLGLFGVKGDSSWTQSVADEIRGMLDYHTREGSMRKHYRDMLRSVLDLADVNFDANAMGSLGHRSCGGCVYFQGNQDEGCQ